MPQRPRLKTPGVYIQEIPSGVRSISGVPTAVTAFIGRAASGPILEPSPITNFGDFERKFGGLHADSRLSFAVRDFFQNGGRRALIIRIQEKPGNWQTAVVDGLQALGKADHFNLLCIPPYDTSDVDTAVWQAAIDYCEKRRAFLIIDPPASWIDKNSALQGMKNWLRSKNAAVYFPRLKQVNPLQSNQLEAFVPCGAVAGVIARTDDQRGVWKAPAGLDAAISGISSLSLDLTDVDSNTLNPRAINCLRTMNIHGHLIWGARTLEGDDQLASEWKYIPVRRTALYIEESIFRDTHWAVFEPNDELLWAQLRLHIDAFMQALFRQGAFQGAAAKDAYFVKCDSSTTTQADIARKIVHIIVGFAPLKPAEFVLLHIRQKTG
jgi:phage tail sheath protein FI